MDNIWYIVLLIVGYLLLNKINLIENFPYGQPQWLKPWMIWNQPTRFPKLFCDTS